MPNSTGFGSLSSRWTMAWYSSCDRAISSSVSFDTAITFPTDIVGSRPCTYQCQPAGQTTHRSSRTLRRFANHREDAVRNALRVFRETLRKQIPQIIIKPGDLFGRKAGRNARAGPDAPSPGLVAVERGEIERECLNAQEPCRGHVTRPRRPEPGAAGPSTTSGCSSL